MTNQKVISVDGDRTGGLVFWEPSEATIEGLGRALKGIGLEKLLPQQSVAKAALKETMTAVIRKSPLYVRGNIPEIFPLASHVVGFEARRLNRGLEENNPEFVFSAVLNKEGTVEIPKFNDEICPWMDGRLDEFENVMTKRFTSRAKYYPTGMVSTAISRVIESLGGILVRKTGGNYFLPDFCLPTFEAFCDLLDEARPGPEIIVYKFNIKPTERSFTQVLNAVKREVEVRLAQVQVGLDNLGLDRLQRSDGKASRLSECSEVLSLVERYESLLGVDLKEYKAMAEQVRGAVDAHAVLEVAC